jgi:hypothetical protein
MTHALLSRAAQVWGMQRGWGSQPGAAPNGFAFATLLARLEAAGLLAAAMSRVQMFRAALAMLSGGESSWVRLGCGSLDNDDSASSTPSFADFVRVSRSGSARGVLIDSSGWVDVLGGLPSSAVDEMAAAAQHTLAALGRPQPVDQTFQQLFMHKYGPCGECSYC